MKHRFKKRIYGLVSAVMALAMIVGLLPALTVPAEAGPVISSPDFEENDTTAKRVDTYEELVDALQDPTVKMINLVNNIEHEIKQKANDPVVWEKAMITVKGTKTLDLRGCKIEISHNDMRYEVSNAIPYASESTLLEIPIGAMLTIDDTGGGGKIRYYNKPAMDTGKDYARENSNFGSRFYMPLQRNLIDNRGTLVVLDGTLEAGCTWKWIQEVDDIPYLAFPELGYVRNLVGGKAVMARDTSTTIVNGGKIWGRGYYSSSANSYSYFWVDYVENAAITFMDTGTAKVFINGGEICGKDSANTFQVENESLKNTKIPRLAVSGGSFTAEKLDRFYGVPFEGLLFFENRQGNINLPQENWLPYADQMLVGYDGEVVTEGLEKLNTMNNVSFSLVRKPGTYTMETPLRVIKSDSSRKNTDYGSAAYVNDWIPGADTLFFNFPEGRVYTGMEYKRNEWNETAKEMQPGYTASVTWEIWDCQKGYYHGNSKANYSYTKEYPCGNGKIDLEISTAKLTEATGIDWTSSTYWEVRCRVKENVLYHKEDGVISTGTGYQSYTTISAPTYVFPKKAAEPVYTAELIVTDDSLLSTDTAAYLMVTVPNEIVDKPYKVVTFVMDSAPEGSEQNLENKMMVVKAASTSTKLLTAMFGDNEKTSGEYTFHCKIYYSDSADGSNRKSFESNSVTVNITSPTGRGEGRKIPVKRPQGIIRRPIG